MTIDERVYGYEPATSQLAELRAEIERLRREHEKAWADAQLKAAEIERLRDAATAYVEILADKQRHYDTLSKNAVQLFDQRAELLLKVNEQANDTERLKKRIRDLETERRHLRVALKEG